MNRSTLISLLLVTAACHKQEVAAAPTEPEAPAGQVWLTTAQVKDARIETQIVKDQDVDDTILTSGRVALEDVRSGHVFSPVTGRVVSIKAQLGQNVKKGDPLAVIESPDIGSAVSDVH
jgi:cobalt-zinc-cadmium efflux system membrane fusion protein